MKSSLTNLFCVVIIVTGTVLVTPKFVINVTPSFPEGVYRLAKTDRSVGELIWFDDVSRIAADRDYVPSSAKLMKEIVATEGTSYCVGREFRVGETSYGLVHASDSLGRPLPNHFGCRIVPTGHVLTGATAEKSFDSRYIGPVPFENVHGKLEALWTW